MNVVGYLWCAFGLISLISTIGAINLQNEQNDQKLYDLLTTNDLTRAKKPFCNAFTGCGKKRSFSLDKSMDNVQRSSGKISIPVPIYRALLQAASRNVRQIIDRGSSAKNLAFDEYSYLDLNNELPSLHRYQS